MDTQPKVLVVDDDVGIRETMSDILELEGYAVDCAENGELAVESIEKSHYQVVLLDMRMPGMDGLETLRAIKELDPEARVIIITGFEVGERARMAMEGGAEALFRKPLDVATFLPVLLATAEEDLPSEAFTASGKEAEEGG